jgi:NAD+ diphosphatase
MSFLPFSIDYNINDTFIFFGNNLIFKRNNEHLSKPIIKELLDSSFIFDSFIDTNINSAGIILKHDDSIFQTDILSNIIQIPLRQYFYESSQDCINASRILALANWRNNKRFCSYCGSKLLNNPKLTALSCPTCNDTFFPRIEPCIIILISKGNEILLAKHRARNQDIYTCLAGFMECGENIEECAKREVREEVGIEIKNIRYCASQSWPFPDQLMIGLRAEYESGIIKLQEDEISEATWFEWNKLPNTIAKPGSLSYSLIHKEFN